MDPNVAKRLLLAKFQLNAGKRELAGHSDFAAAEAVLRFHDAMETFFLAIADHLGAPRAFVPFHKYPGRISEQANGRPFKHTSVVNELNDLRSPLKHYGRYPSFRDVHDLSARIDLVFEDNSLEFLGVSFDSIRMAASIRHVETSEHVRKAEELIDSGDYLDGMTHLAAAFDTFITQFKNTGVPRSAQQTLRFPHELLRPEDVRRWLSKDGNQQRVLEGVNREWQEATQRLELMALGINVAEYATFQYLCPIVYFTEGGKMLRPHVKGGAGLRFTEENAQFCLNFVLQVVSRLENLTSVRDVRSSFEVKLTTPTPFFRGGTQQRAGELSAGHVIKGAHCALGPGPTGDVWSWEQDGERFYVDFAGEIVREVRLYEQSEERKKRLMNPEGAAE
jgi:hypothetical protein